MLDGVDEFADVDADAELFADFPFQSLAGRLAGLELSSGELPLALELAVTAGGREDLCGFFEGIADHCGNNFDRLHCDDPPFCKGRRRAMEPAGACASVFIEEACQLGDSVSKCDAEGR